MRQTVTGQYRLDKKNQLIDVPQLHGFSYKEGMRNHHHASFFKKSSKVI